MTEAGTGIEPVIKDLQSSALPLGHPAGQRRAYRPHTWADTSPPSARTCCWSWTDGSQPSDPNTAEPLRSRGRPGQQVGTGSWERAGGNGQVGTGLTRQRRIRPVPHRPPHRSGPAPRPPPVVLGHDSSPATTHRRPRRPNRAARRACRPTARCRGDGADRCRASARSAVLARSVHRASTARPDRPPTVASADRVVRGRWGTSGDGPWPRAVHVRPHGQRQRPPDGGGSWWVAWPPP